MIEAKWFGSFWKHLWGNSVIDSSIKKSLMIFVIAPELGSASPVMTHAFQAAACCECAYLELCLPLLREEQRGSTSGDASGFVLPSSNWTAECTLLFIVPVARFLALLLC